MFVLFVFPSDTDTQICNIRSFLSSDTCSAPDSERLSGLWRMNNYTRIVDNTLFLPSGFLLQQTSLLIEETVSDLRSARGITVGIFGFRWDTGQANFAQIREQKI